MAVLVTGGAGYIGSVTVELLRAQGEQVVVLDNLSRGHREAGPADAPGSSECIRDLVYWGAGGPIRIRLHLQIDGRSVDSAWSDAVQALFKFCDRNGDGILDSTELAPFSEPRGRNPQLAVDANSEPPLRLTFEDRKAPVTLALPGPGRAS